MSNEPDKIYLQIGEVDSDIDFNELAGVTWSEDNIYATDIKYHHDRKYQKAIKAIKLMLAQCGIPDAGDACRAVIKTGKEILAELGEVWQ